MGEAEKRQNHGPCIRVQIERGGSFESHGEYLTYLLHRREPFFLSSLAQIPS